MAIKIQRSNRKVADFQTTPLSAASLPVFQIAAQVESGVKGLLAPIEKARKQTKVQEDKNKFRILRNETLPTISKALRKYSNSTDIGELENLFKDLDPKNFNNLLDGQSKEVKNLFNKYLSDTIDKNYDGIYAKIISNHTEQSYLNDENFLIEQDKDLASDDPKTRITASLNKSAWFKDPNNEKRYSVKAWDKLQQDSAIREVTFQLGNETRNNPFKMFELGKELTDLVGIDTAKLIKANAQNAIVSQYIDEGNYEDIKEKATTREQVENFSYVLRFLNVNKGIEVVNGAAPISLDDINDMFKSGQINSAMRNTLYRIKVEDTKFSDFDTLQLINGAIHSAETIEDIDLLNSTVLSSMEIADRLGIRDIERFDGIFNKYKTDRPGFIKFKETRKLLAADLGKVEITKNNVISLMPANKTSNKPDEKVAILGLSYYDSLIRDGFKPEDAYAEVARKYLDEVNLPSIYNVALTTSIKLDPPSDEELKAGKVTPESYFKNARQKVSEAYKKTGDLKTFASDIESLSVIEDMFYIRKQQFESEGKDGIEEAFAETNQIKPKKIKGLTPPN